jgi:ankyrin repeat protein
MSINFVINNILSPEILDSNLSISPIEILADEKSKESLIESVLAQNLENVKQNIAQVGLIDENGKCALDYASLLENKEIIDLLEQYEYNVYDKI